MRPTARRVGSGSRHGDPEPASPGISGRSQLPVRATLHGRYTSEEQIRAGPAADVEALVLESGSDLETPAALDMGRLAVDVQARHCDRVGDSEALPDNPLDDLEDRA